MTKLRTMLMGIMALALCVGADVSCTPAEQQIAKDVIDVTTATCLMTHAELPDGELQKLCHWEVQKADTVKQLIGVQRDVLAKARTDFAAQRTAPCDGKR